MSRILFWLLTFNVIGRSNTIWTRIRDWIAAPSFMGESAKTPESFIFSCTLITLTAFTAFKYWVAGILSLFWNDIHTISLRNIVAAFIVSTGVDLMLGVGSTIIRWLDRKEEKAYADGRADTIAEFKAWLERKKATEARGEMFDEPMPGDEEENN